MKKHALFFNENKNLIILLKKAIFIVFFYKKLTLKNKLVTWVLEKILVINGFPTIKYNE